MKLLPKGVGLALLSAALFGASTPLAKLLLGELPPVLLASLLYLGSGVGLAITYLVRRRWASRDAPLRRKDLPWLAGAVVMGGMAAPVLLMYGLRRTPASSAALLLNLEGLLTTLLAWFVFRENFDRRIAFGMALILSGGIVLSMPSGAVTFPLGSLLVAAACFCWAVDNNLTQRVSAGDPILITAIKGLGAGAVNLGIAWSLGAAGLPALGVVAGAALVGLLGYGVSLVLFVLALRHLGTARTGAYFSLAPFMGAAVAVVFLRESVSTAFWIASALMGAGAWLHLTERHGHEHRHDVLTHTHRHVHDEHHAHAHPDAIDPSAPHAHEHTHEPLTHSHPHFPDIHHRHKHGRDS